jgi:hypothetical protein
MLFFSLFAWYYIGTFPILILHVNILLRDRIYIVAYLLKAEAR